jgi:diketogulonate reductase-like aldo/keto reductase
MPLLGFGTWQLTGSEATNATAWALEAGYRHIDTATMYRNEGQVGGALRQSGVPRDEVFITTKLPPQRGGAELGTLRESLRLLGTDFVDLWLIHWPPNVGAGERIWEAFIVARDDGLARDIGVSNYSLEQLDVLSRTTGVTPAVNQIEWSPLLFDRGQLDGHRERDVVLEGYSALRGGTLEQPVVVELARRYGRTPAQVIIRWHVQHGIVVIPKSRDRDRIRSNADVNTFQLSASDMTALDSLGRTPG